MKEENVKNKNEVVETTKEIALDAIIRNVIKLPGVKVDRQKFLTQMFANEVDDVQKVINLGPIEAGVDEKTLKKISSKLILEQTSKSAFASFAMGMPGGFAMSVTIPGDIMQFYGMTLRVAQQLIYMYGAQDMWIDGNVDEEMIKNQFILYCGVMFGVAGATSAVRLLSAQVAKIAENRLQQKALTKTVWYPIIKKICNSVGVKITKTTLKNGVTKVVPIIGGVISGVMTFVSMKPMAERLQKVLEKANFDYTEEEYNKDIEIIATIDGVEVVEEKQNNNEKQNDEEKEKSMLQKGKDKLSTFFKKKDKKQNNLEQIKTLKQLLDMGAITQEEYDQKKKQILGL